MTTRITERRSGGKVGVILGSLAAISIFAAAALWALGIIPLQESRIRQVPGSSPALSQAQPQGDESAAIPADCPERGKHVKHLPEWGGEGFAEPKFLLYTERYGHNRSYLHSRFLSVHPHACGAATMRIRITSHGIVVTLPDVLPYGNTPTRMRPKAIYNINKRDPRSLIRVKVD